VDKYANILNRIYCLSQEACSTIASLRAVPNVAKDINSFRINLLLEKLHDNTLEAFKATSIDVSHEYRNEVYIVLKHLATSQTLIEITRI
jgi:hypothetical protein